jgi:hypothetical protein
VGCKSAGDANLAGVRLVGRPWMYTVRPALSLTLHEILIMARQVVEWLVLLHTRMLPRSQPTSSDFRRLRVHPTSAHTRSGDRLGLASPPRHHASSLSSLNVEGPPSVGSAEATSPNAPRKVRIDRSVFLEFAEVCSRRRGRLGCAQNAWRP